MKRLKLDAKNNRGIICCIFFVLIFSTLSSITITTLGARELNMDRGHGNTRSKEPDSNVTKILFVFDDNATVWVDWYLTIINSTMSSGKILNRTNVEAYAYFVWDQDQDYINSVLNGTPDVANATFNFNADGPAYSGGSYPQTYNLTSHQFETQNWDLKNYDAVVWLTGIDSQYIDGITFTGTDILNLKHYLDNGGKLWLCSPDLISDLYGRQTGSQRYNFVVFPSNDFLAKYGMIYGAYQDFGTPDALFGTEKGLTGGVTYHTSPYLMGDVDLRIYGDHIVPYTDGATDIFNSTASTNQQSLGWNISIPYINAAQWNNRGYGANFKMVFFSFEFCSISDGTERVDLMDKVLKYLLNKPPKVTVTSPTEGQSLGGSVNITGTSSDEDGMVSKVTIVIDNASVLSKLTTNLASWSYTFNTTTYSNGPHQILVASGDVADISDIVAVNFTINNVGGNNPPTVVISSPAENAEVSGTTTISGTSTDPDGNSQLQNVKVRVDSGNWMNATGTTSWTYSLDTTQYTNDAHTIYAKANDGSVDSTVVSRTININNAAQQLPGTPTITTTPHTNKDGNYIINWTSSAYATKYILDEDGVEIYNETALTRQFTNKLNGDYTYKVKAWNANGTSGYSSAVTITVSISGAANLPSTPAITTASYTDTVGNYAINWTTSDYATRYILEENDMVIYNGTDLTYSFQNKPDGTYTYRVKAWNVNGTSGWSVSVNVTVSVAPTPKPDITILNITFKKDNVAVSSATINDTIAIYGTVKNVGDATASNIEVLFYNGDPFQNGTLIGTAQNIASLSANGTSTVSTSQKFTTLGNFTIFVIADKNNTIFELREDNNSLSKIIEVLMAVESKLPNLKISTEDISFSTEKGQPLGFVTEGDRIKITAKVYNTKNEELKGSIKVKFYAGLVSPENFIDSYEITGVSANSYQESWCNWGAKKGAPMEIYVVVESGRSESNTADNIAHKPIFVLEKATERGDKGGTGMIPGFQIVALFTAICLTLVIKKLWPYKK